MNTMCPGTVKTDLPRQYVDKSPFFRIAVAIYLALLGKSAEDGARTYMATALTKEAEHVSLADTSRVTLQSDWTYGLPRVIR
jgi:hypothetical protein